MAIKSLGTDTLNDHILGGGMTAVSIDTTIGPLLCMIKVYMSSQQSQGFNFGPGESVQSLKQVSDLELPDRRKSRGFLAEIGQGLNAIQMWQTESAYKSWTNLGFAKTFGASQGSFISRALRIPKLEREYPSGLSLGTQPNVEKPDDLSGDKAWVVVFMTAPAILALFGVMDKLGTSRE
ncbi:hypothetical protein C8J56DRAFT_898937 [Mycena floridula]|nr:hypothetical protein C8J56DRAFT_898937 [Mycena floridula]